MSFLVVQTSFIGDVVLTTPLLTELASRGPVDVIATPAGASLLANHSAVRRVIVYDKRGADRGIMRFRALTRDLAQAKYDAAFHAQGSLRSAALTWAARIPQRVGFADAAGRRLYTATIENPRARHHAEKLWRLAFPSGELGEFMPPPSLYPSASDKAAVDALLGNDSRPIIALAPGSVWATKRWPYFEPLAEKVADLGRLVIIGGPDDITAGEIIRVKVPDTLIAAGRLSLLQSAELIRRARIIVTNDSSPTHLASAMGTPTIAIFGPTTPGFGFGPLAPFARVVQHEAMPCRPCHHHGPRRCPLGHWKCMRELLPDAVVTAVTALLAESAERAVGDP